MKVLVQITKGKNKDILCVQVKKFNSAEEARIFCVENSKTLPDNMNWVKCKIVENKGKNFMSKFAKYFE